MQRHCLERLTTAATITKDNITMVKENMFQIKGVCSDYDVDMMIPKCTCIDWIKTNYPCKHLFAVKQQMGCHFPDSYLNNVWFRLDENVCAPAELATADNNTNEDDNDKKDITIYESTDSTTLNPVPLQVSRGVKALQSTYMRELFKEMSTMSYLTPENKLKELRPQAEDLLDKMKQAGKRTQEGILEERKTSSYVVKYRKNQQRHLPVWRRRSRWTGRVGKRAELQKPKGQLYNK
jgi:hypothetical protein